MVYTGDCVLCVCVQRHNARTVVGGGGAAKKKKRQHTKKKGRPEPLSFFSHATNTVPPPPPPPPAIFSPRVNAVMTASDAAGASMGTMCPASGMLT